MSDTRAIHALNAAAFKRGDVFGWRDDSSPTGWLSGIVVSTNHNGCSVEVRDIMPGIMEQRRSAGGES